MPLVFNLDMLDLMIENTLQPDLYEEMRGMVQLPQQITLAQGMRSAFAYAADDDTIGELHNGDTNTSQVGNLAWAPVAGWGSKERCDEQRRRGRNHVGVEYGNIGTSSTNKTIHVGPGGLPEALNRRMMQCLLDSFEFKVDSLDANDGDKGHPGALSTNDIRYRYKRRSMPGFGMSAGAVTAGSIARVNDNLSITTRRYNNATKGGQGVLSSVPGTAPDMLRHVAMSLTGGYHGTDLFKNESDILQAYQSLDVDIMEAFEDLLAPVYRRVNALDKFKSNGKTPYDVATGSFGSRDAAGNLKAYRVAQSSSAWRDGDDDLPADVQTPRGVWGQPNRNSEDNNTTTGTSGVEYTGAEREVVAEGYVMGDMIDAIGHEIMNRVLSDPHRRRKMFRTANVGSTELRRHNAAKAYGTEGAVIEKNSGWLSLPLEEEDVFQFKVTYSFLNAAGGAEGGNDQLTNKPMQFSSGNRASEQLGRVEDRTYQVNVILGKGTQSAYAYMGNQTGTDLTVHGDNGQTIKRRNIPESYTGPDALANFQAHSRAGLCMETSLLIGGKHSGQGVVYNAGATAYIESKCNNTVLHNLVDPVRRSCRDNLITTKMKVNDAVGAGSTYIPTPQTAVGSELSDGERFEGIDVEIQKGLPGTTTQPMYSGSQVGDDGTTVNFPRCNPNYGKFPYRLFASAVFDRESLQNDLARGKNRVSGANTDFYGTSFIGPAKVNVLGARGVQKKFSAVTAEDYYCNDSYGFTMVDTNGNPVWKSKLIFEIDDTNMWPCGSPAELLRVDHDNKPDPDFTKALQICANAGVTLQQSDKDKLILAAEAVADGISVQILLDVQMADRVHDPTILDNGTKRQRTITVGSQRIVPKSWACHYNGYHMIPTEAEDAAEGVNAPGDAAERITYAHPLTLESTNELMPEQADSQQLNCMAYSVLTAPFLFRAATQNPIPLSGESNSHTRDSFKSVLFNGDNTRKTLNYERTKYDQTKARSSKPDTGNAGAAAGGAAAPAGLALAGEIEIVINGHGNKLHTLTSNSQLDPAALLTLVGNSKWLQGGAGDTGLYLRPKSSNVDPAIPPIWRTGATSNAYVNTSVGGNMGANATLEQILAEYHLFLGPGAYHTHGDGTKGWSMHVVAKGVDGKDDDDVLATYMTGSVGMNTQNICDQRIPEGHKGTGPHPDGQQGYTFKFDVYSVA
tara:strand:- start:322 stop:3882 length:3561 start_codon:yes stop_codon:yes gene_type:complete